MSKLQTLGNLFDEVRDEALEDMRQRDEVEAARRASLTPDERAAEDATAARLKAEQEARDERVAETPRQFYCTNCGIETWDGADDLCEECEQEELD